MWDPALRVAESMGWNEGDEVQVHVGGKDVLRISKEHPAQS